MTLKTTFILSTFLCVFASLQSFGQENQFIASQIQLTRADSFFAKDSNDVFVPIEKFPEYPGGMEKLYQYLQKNLQYPQWEKENNIQGRVRVSFVVEKDGSLTNIEILETVPGSKNFDNEIFRLVNNMSKWNPAEQGGRAVRCRYTIPVMFSLNNNKKIKKKAIK